MQLGCQGIPMENSALQGFLFCVYTLITER